MMKKRKSISIKGLVMLAFLVTVLFIARPVQADIIWTPNDDFFNAHYEECEQLERSYTANGEKGYIAIKKNPNSKETVANKENGTEFYVSFTYTDEKDRVWGVVEYDDSTGWILMEELVVIYDDVSFLEEHKNEFQAYQGEFDDYVPEEEPVQFYQYPGSGASISAMQIKEDKPEISYTYKDSEDRLWGYVNYYFKHRGWICFNDPTNASIPGSKVLPQVTVIPRTSELPKPSGFFASTEVILLAILVIAVVIGTGVIIRIFWKKK